MVSLDVSIYGPSPCVSIYGPPCVSIYGPSPCVSIYEPSPCVSIYGLHMFVNCLFDREFTDSLLHVQVLEYLTYGPS